MHITTAMLQEMEQAMANDAQAEIRVYPAGCTIRVSWNGKLSSVQKQVAFTELSTSSDITHERMDRAWKRLIKKFQDARDSLHSS